MNNLTLDNLPNLLQVIGIWAIPILLAITLHEVAHGWVAGKLGDKTATLMGRVTLNPLKHIDLIGTIIVPIVFLLVGGFVFGWAKPVPVDYRNLRNRRWGMSLVALAGPIANLLMALFWAGVAKLSYEVAREGGVDFMKIFVLMGLAGISINLMLMILNLIPIPPLDGSRVVSSILWKYAGPYERLEPFGLMILVLLIFSGVLSNILQPPYVFAQEMIRTAFGL